MGRGTRSWGLGGPTSLPREGGRGRGHGHGRPRILGHTPRSHGGTPVCPERRRLRTSKTLNPSKALLSEGSLVYLLPSLTVGSDSFLRSPNLGTGGRWGDPEKKRGRLTFTRPGHTQTPEMRDTFLIN